MKSKNSPWLVSAREFLRNVFSQIVSKILLGVGGLLGVLALFFPAPASGHPFLPRILWLPFVEAGLIWSAFSSFHSARERRDELVKLMDASKYCLSLEEVVAVPRIARKYPAADRPGYQIRLTYENSSSYPLMVDLNSIFVQPDGLTRLELQTVSQFRGTIPPGKAKMFTGWYYGEIDPIHAITVEFKISYGVPTSKAVFEFSGQARIGWDNVAEGQTPHSFWDFMVDNGHSEVLTTT